MGLDLDFFLDQGLRTYTGPVKATHFSGEGGEVLRPVCARVPTLRLALHLCWASR